MTDRYTVEQCTDHLIDIGRVFAWRVVCDGETLITTHRESQARDLADWLNAAYADGHRAACDRLAPVVNRLCDACELLHGDALTTVLAELTAAREAMQ